MDLVEALIIISGFLVFLAFLSMAWGNPIVGAPLCILYIAALWYLYLSWKNTKEKRKNHPKVD
jgi:Flp pilus assembly protein TadB